MGFTWRTITKDGVVSPNPSQLGAVILSPDGTANVADITLYDGESTSDPKILTIYSGTGSTRVINFTPYLETKRGLYVDIGSNVDSVLVQLCWDDE